MTKKPRRTKKQSSTDLSSLAGKILNGSKKPTLKDIKRLAASVLSQDETRGPSKKKK